MAETMFNDTIKDTLEKADPLEIHVKTVTMRAESLATTDADFFKTLVNRQGKPRTSLNATVASSQSRTESRLNFHGEMLWRCRSQHSHPYQTVVSREAFFQVLEQSA